MNKKYTYLIIICLTVASLATFGRILGNDFINFDDTVFIIENQNIQSGFTLQSIQWAFSTIHHSYWHPLTWLSITLDWSLFGSNAGGHHLVSLFLHIGAVVMLFLFLYKTTNNIWPSAFAAAFFAFHPLRVESVAWTAERKDVLSMFFGMSTLYAYSFYAEKSNLFRYFLCLGLFICSLMSKPMMVTIPFVLLLMDYWPLGRWPVLLFSSGRAWKSAGVLIQEKIPFLILTIVASILAFWAQNKIGTVVSMEQLPFFVRSTNAIYAYIAYLGKIFFPHDLAILYPYEYLFPLWQILSFFCIFLCATIIVFYFIRRIPFLFVGWLWYLGTLVPVIGFIQVGYQSMADRYTYLPSIGIAIILAWGVPLLFPNKNIRNKVLFPSAIFVLLVFIIFTYQQCGYWKNSITLYNHSLQGTKDNLLLQTNLAIALSAEGKKVEAITIYDRLIRLAPNMSALYYNRGNVFADLRKYQKAIEDYNRAIHLDPQYADAYNNRGTIYEAMGQYQKAIEDCSKAISITPGYVAYFNRGNNYNRIGRNELALMDFSQAISIKPDFADAYNNRGVTYITQGKNKEGCRDAHTACKLGNCNLSRTVQDQRVCSETR